MLYKTTLTPHISPVTLPNTQSYPLLTSRTPPFWTPITHHPLLTPHTASSVTYNYNHAGGDKYYRTYTFPQLQQANRLITAANNLFVDNNIIALDGTFGYYLQTTTPTANVAWFCSDDSCISPSINPADNGHSIAKCQNDANTIVNPSRLLYSYDLMVSSSPGCYPIVGTVDMVQTQPHPSYSSTQPPS